MKKYYIGFLLVLFALILTSCQEDEVLIPTFPESLTKYVIDEQGPHYDKINYILDNYGTLLVYDKYTRTEINVIDGLTNYLAYNCRYPNSEQLEFMVNFLCQNLFNPDCLPIEYGARVFKPYTFLTNELNKLFHPLLPAFIVPLRSEINGKDFWCINLQCVGDYKFYPTSKFTFPTTPKEVNDMRCLYFDDVFTVMFKRKIISAPIFLASSKTSGGLIDYHETIVGTWSDREKPNFFIAMGSPGNFFNNAIPKMNAASKYNGFYTPEQVFKNILMLSLMWSYEEITGEYSASHEGEKVYSYVNVDSDPTHKVYHKDYPFFVDIYKKTVEYMRDKYNWDITYYGRTKYNEAPAHPNIAPTEEELGQLIPEE